MSTRRKRVKAFAKATLRAMEYHSVDEVPPERKQTMFRQQQAMWAFMACVWLALGFGGLWEYVLVPLTLMLAIGDVFAVARRYEGRSPRELFDLRHGSWAFLIGDLVLVATITVQVANWNQYQPSDARMFVALGILLVCMVIFTRLFRWFDRRRYVRHDALLSYEAPSKYAHDMWAGVLSAALLTGCAPLLLAWTWHGWVLIGGVAVYTLLALADLYRDARGLLDPVKQHPAWDAEKFRLAAESK